MEYKTNINFRKEVLTKLLNEIILHENEIVDALYFDFKKPAFEAVLSETNYVISELKDTIKNLNKWSKPRRVFPSLLNFPAPRLIRMAKQQIRRSRGIVMPIRITGEHA